MKKTVLITGASTGIGEASVHYFAAKGWNVAATMREPKKVILASELDRIRVYRLDVTDPKSISAAFDAAEKDFGQVDVVINNAGYGVDGVFEAMSDETISKQFETNVFGLMRVTREAIIRMRPRRAGTIVQIASVGGRATFPLYSIYHGTKWAVEGFSESLHFELRPFNIHVRIVEPGAIKTDFYGRSREFVNPTNTDDYDNFVRQCNQFSMETGNAGVDPIVVAKTIFKAATATNWRLRYPVAYPANVLLPLRRILPESWVYAFIRMTYKI